MASNNLMALCHPLPYGRRATPLKEDGRALEGETDDYAAPAQGQRRDVGPAGPVTSVAIGPVRPSPPFPTPPRALHHHHQHCGGGDRATRRRHVCYCAPCGLPSAVPSSQCTDGNQTGDPYIATLEAAPGWIQGTPRCTARYKIRQESRLLRGTVCHASTRRQIVWHACKLLPPWPIKGRAIPQPQEDRMTDIAHSQAFRLDHDIGTCLNQYLWDLEDRPPLPPRL
jgi:hypothetical protein